MKITFPIVPRLFLLACASIPALSVGQAPSATLGQATALLRTALITQDYEGGSRAADSLVRKFPTSAELGALRVLLRGAGASPEAWAAADSLVRSFPHSPWAAFAKGRVIMPRRYRLKEALTLADRALAAQPRNQEFIALRAEVLGAMGLRKEAETFLNAQFTLGRKTPMLLATKAKIILAESGGSETRRDTTARARALALIQQLLRADSNNIWVLGNRGFLWADLPLLEEKTSAGDEATYALRRRALRLLPYSYQIHQLYWQTVLQRPGRTDVERRAEIDADLTELLRVRPDYPGILDLVAEGYGLIKRSDEKLALENRILQEFPNSSQAEGLILARIEAFGGSTDSTTPAAESARVAREYHHQLKEFIARPLHLNRGLLASAYRTVVTEDTTLSPDSLVSFIRTAISVNRNLVMAAGFDFAQLLVDRKADLPFARELTMRSDTVCRAALDNTRENQKTPGDYAAELSGCKASTHEVLGLIAFAQGNLGVARKELVVAVEADRGRTGTHAHLGRVLEAAGEPDSAEVVYAAGAALEYAWKPDGDDNQKALKQLYVARHGGSTAGFEDYLLHLSETFRERRHAKILTSRIDRPVAPYPFTLERFGTGEKVSSASLIGKIAVINVWGVWCGPCVYEAPEIQEFYNKFKGDTSVVFLTVDYNDTQVVLRDYMAKHKFSFPVLLGTAWAKNSQHVPGYPTTLFLDRSGRIAFLQDGGTDQLVEEFTWRVEALKADARIIKP